MTVNHAQSGEQRGDIGSADDREFNRHRFTFINVNPHSFTIHRFQKFHVCPSPLRHVFESVERIFARPDCVPEGKGLAADQQTPY